MLASGGLFGSAAHNLGQLRRAYVSWVWVGIVLGIQALVAIGGGAEALVSWYEIFGLDRAGFLSGKVWQVFSYGLLHGSWWHVGLNALFVMAIGPRIEHMAGGKAMARAVVAGILGGGTCHLLLGNGLLVGLSGGCLGLLLLLTTLSPQSRMWPLPVSGKNLGLGIMAAALFLALVNPALGLPGLSIVGRTLVEHGLGSWFQMGHACHFGGGLAGVLYGHLLLRVPVTLERLRRDRARREAN